MRDEKLELSASRLPAGSYIITYQIRLSVVGVYRVIPSQSYEFYFPDMYGRGSGMLFTIQPDQ
jgi:hypothetical protein